MNLTTETPRAQRRIISFFLVLALVLCLVPHALDSQSPSPTASAVPPLPVVKVHPPAEPIRAVQLLTLAAADYPELDRRFQAFRAAGVNTVILRVFHNPGDRFLEVAQARSDRGVYFQNSQMPVVDDVLLPIVELAHRHGLRLFAWMTTRYADYGVEDNEELRCMAYDFATGRPAPARGQSVLLPEVQTRLVRVFEELARYPIDGVLLQDDLMLRHNEDFNPRVQNLYRLTTGREMDPQGFYRGVHPRGNGKYRVDHYSPEFWQWSRWKRDRLLDLAERLREAVHRGRPGIPVGLNLYYETALQPEDALAWFSQDLEAAAGRDFEFLCLMLYHRQMQKEMGLTPRRLFAVMNSGTERLLAAAGEPGRAVLKFQTVDWETGESIPSAELQRYLDQAARHPGVSLALVPAGASLDLEMVSAVYSH